MNEISKKFCRENEIFNLKIKIEREMDNKQISLFLRRNLMFSLWETNNTMFHLIANGVFMDFIKKGVRDAC